MKPQAPKESSLSFLTVAVILTTLTTAYFGFVNFNSSKALMEFLRRDVEVRELQGEILRLDEVLTMSARMAAATGDRVWEERYDQNDPILDSKIKRLKAVVPGTLELSSAEETDQANQALIAMERKSFEWDRKGRLAEAARLLSGPEYRRQKEIYAHGMRELNHRIDEAMNREQTTHERGLRFSFYLSITLFFVSSLGWLLLIRQIKRRGREIRALNDHLRIERDAAEQANRSKSTFLANMSHELRTPMHGILSFARFGQQRVGSATKEKLKSYFDDIHDSGTRLMSLLNDLLDLSKLEAGKATYVMQEENLVETIALVQTEVRAFAEEKGLKLEARFDAPEITASFDRERIMQVLRNLLSNAIKFSRRGTTIRIRLSRDETQVLCQVINQGIGIPAEELESIFDKFVQSSKTRTGAGGTGLGLAICREIVSQHGGRIWAESEANGETRFTLALPASRVAATSRHSREAA